MSSPGASAPRAADSPAEDPLVEFRSRLALAAPAEPEAGTAMSLATVDADGRPSARMVLLKQADARGFSFFTNYGSRKAGQLDHGGHAALCWFWPSINQQVRAEGAVARLSADESDAYFASRPRASQVGAWASRQSAPLASRRLLEERVAAIDARFAGQEIRRPPFWGGYLLTPRRIEFWTGDESRLHHRWLYRRADSGWTIERLFP